MPKTLDAATTAVTVANVTQHMSRGPASEGASHAHPGHVATTEEGTGAGTGAHRGTGTGRAGAGVRGPLSRPTQLWDRSRDGAPSHSHPGYRTRGPGPAGRRLLARTHRGNPRVSRPNGLQRVDE